jgi:hypothetical protein
VAEVHLLPEKAQGKPYEDSCAQAAVESGIHPPKHVWGSEEVPKKSIVMVDSGICILNDSCLLVVEALTGCISPSLPTTTTTTT